MKYLKRINEFRTIGFRYSEPKEQYKVHIVCGYYENEINIDVDMIKKALLNIDDLKFDENSITKNAINKSINDNNGVPFRVDSEMIFDISVYKEEEIETYMKELNDILMSVYKITVIDMKYFKKYELK